mgnify:CR=1 FL=1
MLPVDFELITTVPAFVVSASATKSETLFAVTDPPVTTKSSPVVKSLITSDPALILKVSLPAPPVRSSSSAPGSDHFENLSAENIILNIFYSWVA